MTEQTKAMGKPMDELKRMLSKPSVQEQFKNALQENANLFVASIIDLYGSSVDLQQCDPARLIAECLKAATLKLPINRQLGFAWIVPYKVKGVMTPQFQVGYKGYIQLALRTGQYRFINAGVTPEGITVERDRITGMVQFHGTATSDQVQGYFAHLELLNGFSKTAYMTRAEVEKHANRFSKSYAKDSSPWKTDFDAMAMKTCIRLLLSKYGYMSIDMAQVISAEAEEDEIQSDIDAHANREPWPGAQGEALTAGESRPQLPECFV